MADQDRFNPSIADIQNAEDSMSLEQKAASDFREARMQRDAFVNEAYQEIQTALDSGIINGEEYDLFQEVVGEASNPPDPDPLNPKDSSSHIHDHEISGLQAIFDKIGKKIDARQFVKEIEDRSPRTSTYIGEITPFRDRFR